MITRNEKAVPQMQLVSIDQLVPEDHLLRKVDAAIDFNFIYDLVEEKYSPDMGRPSIDPVTLIKIPVIQYMYGIKSMRQTIKEIEVNMAYRWFLGLDFYDNVPHFSTFGKNYKRRFEGTDLFEQIFQSVLLQCMNAGLVDTETIFVDATHVKAAANRKKSKKILVAKKSARAYDEQLRKEIDKDRAARGKKPLKDRDDHDDPEGGSPAERNDLKEQKQSTVDPESGWFHKGEHKEVFAYSVQTGCDKHRWVLDYTIHPGNEHDSKTFPSLYEKLKELKPKNMVMDAGYKNPATAKMLMDEGIQPVYPYTRSGGKKGMIPKREFIYDEYYDCYLCPQDQVLKYSTTNREGSREYKSDKNICVNCPLLDQCTQSKTHQKIVTRHIWQDYLDICEEKRFTEEGKTLYAMRKETIERDFGTAKEHHAMRYTQMRGKEKMSMKVAMTFACMNMKKLAGIVWKNKTSKPNDTSSISCSHHLSSFFQLFAFNFCY